MCTVSITFPPGGLWCPAAPYSAPSTAGYGCKTPQASEHLCVEIKCHILQAADETMPTRVAISDSNILK